MQMFINRIYPFFFWNDKSEIQGEIEHIDSQSSRVVQSCNLLQDLAALINEKKPRK